MDEGVTADTEREPDGPEWSAPESYPTSPARAARACLSGYLVFSGRASRSEFWWFMLIVSTALAAARLLDLLVIGAADRLILALNALGVGGAGGSEFLLRGGAATETIALALAAPTLAVGWRRMHDVGLTGAALLPLLAAAPAAGALVLLGMAGLELTANLGLFLALPAGVVYTAYLLARPGTPGPNRFG